MARVAVIGGGVAGLSAGIEAAMHGHKVTVCERCAVAGGNLVGWERAGYHIDNCIHWLTGTNQRTKLYKTWRRLGVLDTLEVYQPNTLYTVECDGKSLSLYSSITETERAMLASSEGDGREIRSLIRAVRAMNVISGTEPLSPKSIPHFLSLWGYLGISARELSERFHSPLLRKFVGSFFGSDFGAIALINVFSTFTSGNGALPRGGSSAMAAAMAKRLKELGGELLLSSEVTGIDTEGGRATAVQLSDGSRLACDCVLLSCDPKLAEDTLGLPMPHVLKKRYASLPRFSSCHFAFSLDVPAPPFSSDIILDIPKKYAPLLGGEVLILREFSHESSFAPAGKTLIQAMIFVSSERAKKIIDERKGSYTDYKRRKEKLAGVVSKIILSRFPELSGELTLIDSWTPATVNRYFGSHDGVYMSFILPKGYLPKRISTKIRGLKNVFLATQWQNLPGGLPVAAECGIRAVRKIKRTKALTDKSKDTVAVH